MDIDPNGAVSRPVRFQVTLNFNQDTYYNEVIYDRLADPISNPGNSFYHGLLALYLRPRYLFIRLEPVRR